MRSTGEKVRVHATPRRLVLLFCGVRGACVLQRTWWVARSARFFVTFSSVSSARVTLQVVATTAVTSGVGLLVLFGCCWGAVRCL